MSEQTSVIHQGESPKKPFNDTCEEKNQEPCTSLVKDVLGRDPSYFHYYSLLTHQQNMLQDTVRTSTYETAILKNPGLYENKLVMDVGAVRAGAKVIAVEASNMAQKLQKLLNAAKLPEDRFLKPGGAMVPSQGNILFAPFTDSLLWSETMTKVRFWEHKSFYGVDLSPLFPDALAEMFGMPVVGYFDANSLMAPAGLGHLVDFTSITLEELQNFTVSLEWRSAYTGIMHGVATWFDIYFIAPSTCENRQDVTMSTGPHSERTHWQQTRLLFSEPLAVNNGQLIKGSITFSVNAMRSYNMVASFDLLGPEGITAHRDCVWALQEQTYNYSYTGPIGGEFRPELLGLYGNLSLPNSAVPAPFHDDMA